MNAYKVMEMYLQVRLTSALEKIEELHALAALP
jgi:hypothetical protein